MKYSTILGLFMAVFLFACSEGATTETTGAAEDSVVIEALEKKEEALNKAKEILEVKTEELENLVDGLDDILEGE